MHHYHKFICFRNTATDLRLKETQYSCMLEAGEHNSDYKRNWFFTSEQRKYLQPTEIKSIFNNTHAILFTMANHLGYIEFAMTRRYAFSYC